MAEIKADLHMHGPIGFQDYWLQSQGYEGKNLLKEIADSCFNKGVNLCAITSDEDDIPRGSIHDRFNWLKDNYAGRLPENYEFDTIGKDAGMIVKNGQRLYLVNGQTVRTGKKGEDIDYLVIGTNQIQNHRDLEWTAKTVHENEAMFGGAEHAFCESHGGMGRENMDRLLKYMSFIEGHNSQLIFPVPGFVPVFGNYRRGLNKQAQKYAQKNNIPWIATSDAHRIEDAGISYIGFDSSKLDPSSGEALVKTLRRVIESDDFTRYCRYEKILPWIGWVSKFITGTKLHNM